MGRRAWFVALGVAASGALAFELGGCTTLLGDFDVASVDGSDGGGGDGAAGKANGEACGAAGECASGFCADGVCCDTACSGTCEACNLATPGTCSPIPDGTDPENECAPPEVDAGAAGPTTDEDGGGGGGDGGAEDGGVVLNVPDGGLVSSASVCRGTCNGQRACRYPGSETSCGTSFCNDTATSVRYACDGTGGCDLEVKACSAYSCESDACRSSCADVDDCQSTHFCNPQGQCQPKLGNGVQCVNGGQCASGFCVDGVCCNSSCNEFGGTCANAGSLGQCKCSRDCGAGSCVLWYVDADGDGYGDMNAQYTGPGGTGAIIGCSNETPPTGYSVNKLDCADNSADARPGQTAYFANPIPGTSSYDWNCDGVTTKQFDEFPGATCKFCGPPTECTPLNGGCTVKSQVAFLSCKPAKNVCLGVPKCDAITCGGPIKNDYRDGFVETVACGASGSYVRCGACSIVGGPPTRALETTEIQGCR